MLYELRAETSAAHRVNCSLFPDFNEECSASRVPVGVSNIGFHNTHSVTLFLYGRTDMTKLRGAVWLLFNTNSPCNICCKDVLISIKYGPIDVLHVSTTSGTACSFAAWSWHLQLAVFRRYYLSSTTWMYKRDGLLCITELGTVSGQGNKWLQVWETVLLQIYAIGLVRKIAKNDC
jgi:hypothetical protein